MLKGSLSAAQKTWEGDAREMLTFARLYTVLKIIKQ
jgi:hypothetical protein